MGDNETWLLSIGEVARRAQVPVTALRFYEKAGLVPPPRRVSGRRRYEPQVLRRLSFIGMAKRAGFSLAEVAELLDGFDEAIPASERWRILAARKLPEVEALIEEAGTMKRLLEQGLDCSCLRLDVTTLSASGRRSAYPSPFAYQRGPGLMHAALLFDTLLWKDATGLLIPWLASAWEESANGTEWRFTLRDGVRWHDGRPLTSDDVVFTYEYVTTGPGRRCSNMLRSFDVVAGVTASGPHDVVFQLRHRYAPLPEWIAGRMLIAPRHVWSGVSDPADLCGPEAVVGSGPYRLESFDADAGTSAYVANPDYFLGLAYVRRLEFLAAADPLRALQRGEVDAASGGGEEELQEDAVGSLEQGRYGKISAPGEWARVLQFNLARGLPFDDERFRRAVAHAIDRHELLSRVLKGRGELGSMGGMAPSHPDTPTDLPTYPHDITVAERLLDEVGLRDRDGDGRREFPDGSPFIPELQTGADACPETAALVKKHLERVGIDCRVVVLDPQGADHAAARGRYDMALVGYGSLGGDADWLRIRLSANVQANMQARIHGYDNPLFEKLAAAQLRVTEGERKRLVQDMQRLVANDVPFLHLYVPPRVIFFDKQVFDAWYFTPGGVCGAYPGPLNKHALLTGKRAGFS